jgi:hydrogenase expression/formation protein HypE
VRAKQIVLGHGSGGLATAELIREVFLPPLANPILEPLNDQAVFSLAGARLAFTTDSFVVRPLEFPGGDIGRLAVHGTVNDLAMAGARPLYLSAALVLEEGLEIALLRRIVRSLAEAAESAGVQIVTGDTKVIEQGRGDGMYINTSGIGVIEHGLTISADRAQPGDRILVSGPLGDHGMAVLAQREGLDFETPIESDSAALHTLVAEMLKASREIHCLRDPTRGGLAAILNEIAGSSKVGMVLDEDSIPLRAAVRGLCELLGFDPLHVACEGRLAAVVGRSDARAVLDAMKSHPLGREATDCGEVVEQHPAVVRMRTCVGGTRIVDMPSGELLPRIC